MDRRSRPDRPPAFSSTELPAPTYQYINRSAAVCCRCQFVKTWRRRRRMPETPCFRRRSHVRNSTPQKSSTAGLGKWPIRFVPFHSWIFSAIGIFVRCELQFLEVQPTDQVSFAPFACPATGDPRLAKRYRETSLLLDMAVTGDAHRGGEAANDDGTQKLAGPTCLGRSDLGGHLDKVARMPISRPVVQSRDSVSPVPWSKAGRVLHCSRNPQIGTVAKMGQTVR